MANKEKRPIYFSFFLEACNMISLLDVESAGKVIHAVSDYFTDGIVPEGLSRNENTVFERIKKDVDGSTELYYKKIEAGKKGAEIRWGETV